MKDENVTAEQLRAEAELDQERARRAGLAMDISTIDFEALAREANRTDRTVKGWVAPPPPKDWKEIERSDDGPAVGGKYRSFSRRLTVMLTCAIENDGRAWLHLSVSHPERLPTWGELRLVKEAFLGDREAYQVMPPRSRYVNIHPHCLNVFALLEGDALPDFTRGMGGI